MSNFEKNREDGYIWLWRSVVPDYPELEEQVKTGIKPDGFDIWVEEPPSIAKFFRLLLLLATKKEKLLKMGEVRRSLRCYSIFLAHYNRKEKKWVIPGKTTVNDWIIKLEKADMIYRRKVEKDLILGVTNYSDYQSKKDKREVYHEEHPNNCRTTAEQQKQRDEQNQNSELPNYYKSIQESTIHTPPTQFEIDKIAYDYNQAFGSRLRKANGQDPGFIHTVSLRFLEGNGIEHFCKIHKAAVEHWFKGKMVSSCRWSVLYRPSNFKELLEIAEIKPEETQSKKKRKTNSNNNRFEGLEEGFV